MPGKICPKMENDEYVNFLFWKINKNHFLQNSVDELQWKMNLDAPVKKSRIAKKLSSKTKRRAERSFLQALNP